MQNKAIKYVRKELDLRDDEYPALQHWLRVLPHKEFYVVNIGGLISLWQDEKAWKTGNQAKRIVDFSSTTGQPATEEDYQAFCEIVGVGN